MPRHSPSVQKQRNHAKREVKEEDSAYLPTTFPTPSLSSIPLRMSYAIARGEQGVLTFEPYKSILLPHWRFRTVPIATQSSRTLKAAFDFYVRSRDFVGADMARKFVQMGMTRAKRYANHKGGRKYGKDGEELEKSEGHAGQEEKLEASEVFKGVWRACTQDEGYVELRKVWQKEKKEWERNEKGREKVKTEREVKVEEEDNG